MMKNTSEDPITNSTISMPEVNQEISTCMTTTSENQITRTPYQHSNHKNKLLNQSFVFV